VARELTELIIHRFAQPIAAGDEMILASASAGVAVTAGPTGLDDLLARAQRALDEAKRAGRNCARLVTI
jgi:GGDEF domain-containing protein